MAWARPADRLGPDAPSPGGPDRHGSRLRDRPPHREEATRRPTALPAAAPARPAGARFWHPPLLHGRLVVPTLGWLGQALCVAVTARHDSSGVLRRR